MRWVALICGLVTTTACGRFGFDHTSPSEDVDAPVIPDPDAPMAAPAGFTCNTPQRFNTSGAAITALASVPTTTGHVVVMVDNGGNLTATSFKRETDTLSVLASNLVLDTGVTTTVAAGATGDNVVVSAIYGAPTGTRLYPRDASGGPRGTMTDHVELGADRAISASDTGQLAFATIDATTSNLELRKVDIGGNFVGTPSLIAAGTLSPSYAVLQPGKGGYTLEWRDDNGFNMAVLDGNFAITHGPVTLTTTTGFGQIKPKIAYSSATNTYVVSWHEKNAADDDDVWMQVRAADLSPVTAPVMLDTFASNPEVVADDNGFWVSWINYAMNKLAAAHVSAAGVVAPRSVTTSGGAPSKWTMLRSGTQPVLVWVETGGSGPDMWIDPMCE